MLTAIITFSLLGIGGLVTSHEAGMSVPDWPTSYGYNMFALPIKFWRGGAFFEHSHRLLASGAGFLTTVLAVWLWLKDPRRWMKWLGVGAFLLVVAQGVLGGLRVTSGKWTTSASFTASSDRFFSFCCARLRLFTSRFWQKLENTQHSTFNTQHSIAGARPNAEQVDVECSMLNVRCSPTLRKLVLFTTGLIFVQLILGATMRGQHAGLAIPDFPLAYHKLWPDTSADAVARYNADRVEVISVNPITAFQIELQMIHRCVALAVGILVAFCAWLSWERLGGKNPLAKLAFFWLALIVCQIALGAWTVWSNKAADVATSACAGGRAFSRDRSTLVHYCFWPTGGGDNYCSGKNNIRRIRNVSGNGRKQVK